MKITDLFNVKNKVAVVTGGSRGIGEMITAGFLANGVKVYITARKAPALLEKAKKELRILLIKLLTKKMESIS